MWKRWWLCHATDFQSLMYPCFTFCRILGIFPYKINASTFESSKPHYILSTVIICCVVAVVIKIVLSLIYNTVFEIIDFGDIRNFEGLCFYTFGGFIAITTYVLCGPRMRLLQAILEISSKLPSKSHQKLSRLIHVKDILGTILLIVQVCVFFSKTNMFEFTCVNILIVIFTIYLDLLMFQINMLYVNCVCVLKTCFKRINDNLMYMQRLLLNEINDHRLLRQRNQFLLVELKILKKQHLTISKTVHMLNIIFSLQLLTIIVMSFSEITFELYAYVVRWQNGVFISLDWYIFDVLLVSMIYYTMKITFLVWACETGKNQVKEIAITIHDLLNSTRDEQIKNELQLFSLQILHCKNIFLTKGLTVDATLLTALVGNITTYMLILIQFLITSHSCD